MYNASAYKLEGVGASLTGAMIQYKIGDGEWTTDEPSATTVAESVSGISVRAVLDGYESPQIDNLAITVTRKPVTVKAVATGKQYNTEDPELQATVDGTLNGDEIIYTVTRPGKGTDEAVGTYEKAIVVEGDAEQGNYSVSYTPADFTISTNTAALTLTAENGGGVYNAQPYKLENVAASLTGATIEYQVDGGEWTTNEPSVTNVAQSVSGINVRARLEGYQEVKIEGLSITVTPKPVTVTAQAKEKQFGKEDPEFTATVAGNLNDDPIAYKVERPGAGTDEAVAKYPNAIVASGAKDRGTTK